MLKFVTGSFHKITQLIRIPVAEIHSFGYGKLNYKIRYNTLNNCFNLNLLVKGVQRDLCCETHIQTSYSPSNV